MSCIETQQSTYLVWACNLFTITIVKSSYVAISLFLMLCVTLIKEPHPAEQTDTVTSETEDVTTNRGDSFDLTLPLNVFPVSLLDFKLVSGDFVNLAI